MHSGGNTGYLLLTLVFVLICSTLFEPVMGWVFILVACSLVMRVSLFMSWQKHAPSSRTLNLLALLSGLVLAYFSIQLGLLLAMVNLLVMACALKMMLLRTPKDFYQLVVSNGFLIGCGLIFQQSIVFASIYVALIMLLLLSLACYVAPSRPVTRTIRAIGILSLQSAPIGIALFLVLPQLGPLWQMPTSKNAQTGLSETVSPGDLAELSQSSDLAFRVTFEGAKPAPVQRYWRAMVLEEFDGKTWRISPQRRLARRQYFNYRREFEPVVTGQAFRYTVFAEPTHQTWLYGLDVATHDRPTFNDGIWQGHDYQLIKSSPVVSTFQYSISSYPDTLLNQTLYSLDRRINLQLPETGNPRTQAWVNTLRADSSSDGEYIRRILDHFRQSPFVYTLRPDAMPEDPVDTFLFDRQAGFCAHYASAMTYALRLGGIPARMVTGYQGGEEHDADFMSVHQYDAHAWVEAWFDDRGWVRYDPTAVVSPERVAFGLQQALQDENTFLSESPFSLARLKNVAWVNQIRLFFAEVDFLWSKWVLGFDNEDKLDLFKSLIGKVTTERLILFSLSVFATILVLLVIFYLPIWRRPRLGEAQRLYNRAERLLETLGVTRQTWQGPQDFAIAVSKDQPASVSRPFARISQLFSEWEYAPVLTDQGARKQEIKHHLRLLSRGVKSVRRASGKR